MSSALDQSGMQNAMHAKAGSVLTELRPLQVDYANPSSADMVSRGGMTEDIVIDSVDFISERRISYETPVNTPYTGVGPRAAQHLVSVGDKFIT